MCFLSTGPMTGPSTGPGSTPTPPWYESALKGVTTWFGDKWNLVSGADVETQRTVVMHVEEMRRSIPSLASTIQARILGMTTAQISPQQIANLTNVTLWARLLQDQANNIAAPIAGIAPTAFAGGSYTAVDAPKAFWMSLNAIERGDLFAGVIDAVIPTEVRTGARATRFDFANPITAGANRLFAARAAGGVLGLSTAATLGADELAVAQDTLRRRYAGADGSRTRNQDYQNALRGVARLSPTALNDPNQFATAVGATYISGALRLGIIPAAEHQKLLAEVGALSVEANQGAAKSRTEVEKQTREMQELIAERTKTLGEFWGGLNPWLKLAAVASVLYMGMKNKGPAAAVVLGIIGIKYVGWDRSIGNAMQTFRGGIIDAQRPEGETYSHMVDTVNTYLRNSGQVGREIVQEVNALVYVNRLTVKDVAGAFDPTRSGNSFAGVGDGQMLIERLRGVQGGETVVSYFQNPANRSRLNETLAYFFYREAIRAYQEDPAQVRARCPTIDQVVGRITHNRPYCTLANLDTDVLKGDFGTLVSIGYRLSRDRTDGVTVGAIMRAQTGIGLVSQRPDNIENDRRGYLEREAVALGLTFAHDAGTGSVTLSLAGRYSKVLTREDIRRAPSGIELLRQWKNHAVGVQQTALNTASGGTAWTVTLMPDGRKVQYQRSGSLAARADLIPFLRMTRLNSTTPPLGLIQRYTTWLTATGGTEGPDISGL